MSTSPGDLNLVGLIYLPTKRGIYSPLFFNNRQLLGAGCKNCGANSFCSLHRANAAGYEASFSRFKGVSFQGFQVAMAIIITCLLTSKSYEAETVQMYFDREQLCLQCLSFLGVQGGRQGWDSFSPTQALLAYKSDFCVCFHRNERCWILILSDFALLLWVNVDFVLQVSVPIQQF